jgi:hypothetical protein
MSQRHRNNFSKEPAERRFTLVSAMAAFRDYFLNIP